MAILDYPFHLLKAPRRLAVSTIGLALGPTLDGDGLDTNDELPAGSFLEHVVTQPKSGGLVTTFDVTSGRWEPELEAVIRTPANLAGLRLWIGLFSKRPDTVQTPLPGFDGQFAAFRFDLTAPAQPPLDPNKWQAVTSNADDLHIVSIGADVAESSIYVLKIV